MYRWRIFHVAVALLITVGCSGSGEIPVSPGGESESGGQEVLDLTERTSDGDLQNQTYLWGYYDLYFDVETWTVEAVANRSGMFTANVTTFLNMNPAGLSLHIIATPVGPTYIDVEVDITITHPLGKEKFDGYDVRGIFIGDGSGVMDYNPDLVYPVTGEKQVLLNADGYSRWFNPTEFLEPGLLGYTPGLYASKNYTGTATLNGYKYFGEGLGATDDLWTYLDSGDPLVGYFLHGTQNTRRYEIRFPNATGLKYGYAIIADWECGQPGCHPSHCAEAVGVTVDDASTLYYWDETTNGGDLYLDISVFDWDATLSAGVMEDYSICIESSVLTSHYSLDAGEMIPTASGDHWFTFHVEIPADNVTGLDGNEMWVIVEDAGADYTNPFSIPNSADTDRVAACFRYPLYVYNIEPAWIEVTVPNGGEEWEVGTGQDIEWEWGGWIDTVYIMLSLDSGENYLYNVSLSALNDGVFEWDPIPIEAMGETCRIMVADDFSGAYDESDADFTIAQPSITVLSPNGGEAWQPGSDHEIAWTSQLITTAVNIWYSTDDFVTDINSIASGEVDDGSYLWEGLPAIESDTVKVRISTDGGPLYMDDSDGFFMITDKSIQVLIPNGGEEWQPNTDEEITWTSANLTGTVFIEYSKDGFVSDIHAIAADEPDDGGFWWDPIPYDPSDTVRVRVSSTDWPMVNDFSDADFTILEPSITVTSPNGGEEWPALSEQEITWTSENLPGDAFLDIEYSTDGFSSDINLIGDNELNDGSFTWDNLYCEFSDTVRMRINWAWEPGVYDISDADFSLVESGWAKECDNLPAESLPNDLTVDDWGNVFTCGGFGSGISDENAYLAKYNPCGQLIWLWLWEYTEYIKFNTVATDWFGDVYVAGRFDGTDVDLDPSGGMDLHSAVGLQDCVLIKLTGDGDFEWAVTWGGASAMYWDIAHSVATSDLGGVYVTGEFAETVDFDPDPVDTDIQIAEGNVDCFLAKFGESGDYEWARHWGKVSCAGRGRDAETDPFGMVYVTGGFTGSDVDFDPGTDPGEEDLHSSHGDQDAFMSKFTPEGEFLWAVTWGGASADMGESVAVDSSGSPYVGGWFYGTVDFDPDDDPGAVDEHISFGGVDVFLSRFNPAGDFTWANTWGGVGWDYPAEISVDLQQNICAGGDFEGTVDFDPDPGASENRTSNGISDSFLVKFDPSADMLWTRTWGGTGSDHLNGAAANGSTSVYCTGSFYGAGVEFAETGDPCFDASCPLGTDPSNHHVFLTKHLTDGCW